MEEKKRGGFLRWPWNVVIYMAVFAALRLFPALRPFAVIYLILFLILMGIQRKNSPHGVEEGYCLSRTRKQLTWLIWALLALVMGAGLLYMLSVGLKQDRAYWETSDYVTLAVCGAGGPLMVLLGLYLGYTSVRDAFFPEKSALAQSIRNQLPYPDEAPPVGELFAMVDRDLKENGQWFGPVGVGREWVLGDNVTRIERIRGIFVVNELHQHHTKTGVRTSRNMELVLIDDRWQRMATSFNSVADMQAAADCLALRVPGARRGTNGQAGSFWTMDESEREDFERAFRQQQNLRASEAVRREAMSGGAQDMILEAGEDRTSRVTEALAEEHLDRCLGGEEEGFTLIPTRPIQAGDRALRALRVSARGETVTLTAALAGEENLGLAKMCGRREALEVLSGWLRREVPEDLESWDLRRLYAAPEAAGPRRREIPARLSLVYASGAAENHTTFTREDVALAAEGIVDGTYQLADLTHQGGYLWIRVTAGDRTDGCCTVEATRPEGEKLGFYITKMPPREAAAWLTGYPREPFQPGGRNWKRVQKPK